jgi:hypothetical protein
MWDFKFSRRRVWSSESSSGMYCRVKWLSTDVSEVRAASIIPNFYVRFQVLTAASMKFRIVFWDVLPCKIIVDRVFRGTCCLHHQGSTIILHGSTSQKTILNFIELKDLNKERDYGPNLWVSGLTSGVIMELWFPLKVDNFLTTLATISFLRETLFCIVNELFNVFEVWIL